MLADLNIFQFQILNVTLSDTVDLKTLVFKTVVCFCYKVQIYCWNK